MKAAIMVPGVDGGRWDVRDVQRPVVTAGHVLVRVHASSLNRAEFRRLRTLRIRPGQAAPEARTGGGDAAGEVVEIGAGVSGIKPGDRVMGRCAGGFAEFALLDAREVMPAPEALSWEEAACVPVVLSWSTTRCSSAASCAAGETVLVTAAPSGVGVAALLLGKFLGAKVIGTSRSADKLERLKAHGLDRRRRHRQRGVRRGDLPGYRRPRCRHGRRQYRRRRARTLPQGALPSADGLSRSAG